MAAVALGGGLVAAAVVLLGASIDFASSEPSSYAADAQVAKTFFVWSWNFANIAAPPLIALVASTTIVALRFGLFASWFRWFGAIWTALLLMLLLFHTAGLAAMLSLVWIFVASLVLLVHSPRMAPASAG